MTSTVHQEYDSSVSSKVRKTLTLDPDVVNALGDDPAALSTTVNDILRQEIERRERRAALANLVEELVAEHGAPGAEDLERFRGLLAR
jgi:hypothetical protein